MGSTTFKSPLNNMSRIGQNWTWGGGGGEFDNFHFFKST